jgi:hypothetical protein
MFVVVTAFAVWLAWELNFIRARKNILESVYEGRWYADSPGRIFRPAVPPKAEWARIPFWRRVLGDTPIDFVVLGVGHTPEDAKRVRELIPEAQVYRQSGRTTNLIREY